MLMCRHTDGIGRNFALFLKIRKFIQPSMKCMLRAVSLECEADHLLASSADVK